MGLKSRAQFSPEKGQNIAGIHRFGDETFADARAEIEGKAAFPPLLS